MDSSIKRGDIYYADLSPVVGSEQGGIRPVLIVQNNVGNRYSPTVIAAAITSQVNKAKMPTHITVGAPKSARWISAACGKRWDRWMKPRCGMWTKRWPSASVWAPRGAETHRNGKERVS